MIISRTKKAALRIITGMLSLILLIAALPLTISAVYYEKADYDDVKTEDLEAMREQRAEYDKMLKEIKQNLKNAEALQATAADKRAMYLEIEAIYNDQLKDLEKTKLYYESEIEKTGKEIAEIKIEYDKAYSVFLDLLRMSYEEGTANYLEILLGAESFTDLLARIDRVSGLIRYSDGLMDTLSAQQTLLDAKYEQLLKDSAAQDEAIADLEAKQAEIETWKQENESDIAIIEADIEKLTGEQGTYKNLAEMLDADFEAEVEAAIAAENKRREQIAIEKEREEERKRQEALAEAIRKQQYLWPLPPTWDYISYKYGYRTISELGYNNKFHYGIDVPAYRGTDIYASKAGRVLIAKYHSSYGNYVLIDHGDGYQTLYAHASKLYVKAGQYVDQGQLIAAVGTTGTSTGNHLHFEVRVNGDKRDPLDYVKQP
jgi:murein DD-endopeptidase MepM/ murein hydrolase activator NlpD